MTTRVPQEPERSDHLPGVTRREIPGYQLQARDPAPGTDGNERQALQGYRLAKATKRGEMGDRESEHPIVIEEAGEQALLDPVERRGCRVAGSHAGTTPRAWNLVMMSP